jgi:hypothetical protein
MTRFHLAVVLPLIAWGLLVEPAPAQQQQGAAQEAAVGAADVRSRQNAPALEINQHQTPVIAVMYGPQQTEAQITALVLNPEAPQQDKEIIFSRERAHQRIVAHEGEQAGQARRIVLTARRGQKDAQIDKIAETPGIILFGVRREEPEQQEQGQQGQPGQAADASGQTDAAQAGGAQAAGQQAGPGQQAAGQPAQQPAPTDAAQGNAAQTAAAQQAAEPKPDPYDAIITVYLTTGR